MKIGFYSAGILNLTPKEAYQLCMKDAILVDIRENYINAFKKPDVPVLLSIPYSELSDKFDTISKTNIVIVFDSSGLQSRKAVQFLNSKGFDIVYNMAGGFIEWERDGLPIITNIKERLRGSCMCQIKYRDTDK